MSSGHDNAIQAANLVTPIYVDTSALLDVLASLDNGFSFVEKMSTQTTRSSAMDASLRAEAGTEFGIPNVLSFLKIKLGAALSTKMDERSGQQLETERYHTYGSLLFRLRQVLAERGLLANTQGTFQSLKRTQLSDFVEVQGVLRPNPFAESLRGIDRFANLVEIYGNVTANLPIHSSKTGRPGQQSQPDAVAFDKGQMAQVKAVRTFVRGLLEDIEKTDIRIVVVGPSEDDGFSTLLSLFTEYLRDPTMTELAAKEYRVLGRVVGKIGSSSEHYDLLRGTGLSAMGEVAIETLANVLQIGNLPKPETRLPGPALQVVPIAIYI